jgi:hypothetical protein
MDRRPACPRQPALHPFAIVFIGVQQQRRDCGVARVRPHLVEPNVGLAGGLERRGDA